MESLSAIPGIEKRINESGELVKCSVGRKHCCSVNTETLIEEVWYPVCSVECIGSMVLKLLKGPTNYLEFKL